MFSKFTKSNVHIYSETVGFALFCTIYTCLGHIKKLLFPVPARITFEERIKEKFIFYFIEFDVFGTTMDCFSVKADPIVFYFNKVQFYDLLLW